MHRVPASPDCEQHVRGFLNVRAGALSDDHRRELGNDDDRDTGAPKSIKTSRTVWLKRAAISTLPMQNSATREEKEPRAMR